MATIFVLLFHLRNIQRMFILFWPVHPSTGIKCQFYSPLGLKIDLYCLSSGVERLLRDGRAGWLMGPSNEVLRQFIGKTALFGSESLDLW